MHTNTCSFLHILVTCANAYFFLNSFPHNKGKYIYSSYTPFTCPLHASFTPLTPLTRLLPASYTITCIVLTRLFIPITRLLHASYTPLTRLLHNYMYSSFTRLLHAYYTRPYTITCIVLTRLFLHASYTRHATSVTVISSDRCKHPISQPRLNELNFASFHATCVLILLFVVYMCPHTAICVLNSASLHARKQPYFQKEN
jgi:hypothetical protein